MFSATNFYPVRSRWTDERTYLFVFLFAMGNLVLPQLCHLVPAGGRMFLPLYFFTLIAAYKFGINVGIATAILSPLLNSVLFGMPPPGALPVILIKSMLLALIATSTAAAFRRLSILIILFVVICYQIVGSAIEWAITQNFSASLSDLTIGAPGMLIQVIGGWLVLKQFARYEQR